MGATAKYHDLRAEGRMCDEEYDVRMRQARARAGWELGHSSWADTIVRAFMEPGESEERLKAEIAKYDSPAADSAPLPVDLGGDSEGGAD